MTKQAHRALIEKMARALIKARFGEEGLIIFDPVPTGFPNSVTAQRTFDKRKEEARTEATACLAVVYEALREPSEEMLDAGLAWDEHVAGDETYPLVRGTWRAMLSASALSVSPQQEGETVDNGGNSDG